MGLCVLPAPLRAQGEVESRAEAYYVQALQLFNEGRYVEALDYFDRAIELHADPIYYCNRAAVQLKLQASRDALASLKLCRDGFGSGERAEIVEIDAEIKGLELLVEDVEPSARSIASSLAAGAWEGDQPPPTVVVESSSDLILVAAWTSSGIAALTLGGAIAVDLWTQPTIDEFEVEAERGKDRRRYDELRETIDNRKVLIASLATVGVVSLVTAGVLFWLFAEDQENPPSLDVVPTEGGATLRFNLGWP